MSHTDGLEKKGKSAQITSGPTGQDRVLEVTGPYRQSWSDVTDRTLIPLPIDKKKRSVFTLPFSSGVFVCLCVYDEASRQRCAAHREPGLVFTMCFCMCVCVKWLNMERSDYWSEAIPQYGEAGEVVCSLNVCVCVCLRECLLTTMHVGA